MEPDALGPFRIVERVSEDAATITVRARRARAVTVLVKAVRPGLTNPTLAVRALVLEAELLARLGHRAWPTLLEGSATEAEPRIVLSDAGGYRLDRVLARSGALEPTAALAIALEVASALGALHREGLVHGALHPGLVELTAQGHVRVHDPLGASGLPSELVDPAHLSPEQILGEPPDEKSDVFLFGGLLYALLTGRGPFGGDEDGISQRIRHDEPPPPSRGRPAVSRALDRLVLRCLAKRRHDRFGELATVAALLSREFGREALLPADVLVVDALASAGLASPLPRPLGRALGGSRRRGRLTPARAAALAAPLVALAALGFALLSSSDGRDDRAGERARGIVEEPGRIRVLARPWAEVFLDGRRVDVTPMAAALEVRPGRHTITLRHPAAPEESRTVEPIAGQTVLVDVDMKVELASPAPRASAYGAPPAGTAVPRRP